MMDETEILEKLQGIVRRYTDDPEFVVACDMALRVDLGINSYELVQVVVEVEQAFGVEIPDRAISGFRTVRDVLDYIAARSG